MQAIQGAHDWVDYANAVSTIAVACFALVELGRAFFAERNVQKAEVEDRRVTDALISATAYRVSRELFRWHSDGQRFGQMPTLFDGMIEWAQGVRAEEAQHVAAWESMIALSPKASPEIRRSVLQGYGNLVLMFDSLAGVRHDPPEAPFPFSASQLPPGSPAEIVARDAMGYWAFRGALERCQAAMRATDKLVDSFTQAAGHLALPPRGSA